MENTPKLDRDGRPWHPQPAPTFPEGLGIFADEQKARMDAAKTELEQPQKAAPTMSVPDLLQLVEGGPKRKEYGIEMDGIAQMLGLDIFDYDPGDVARAIAKLQAFVRDIATNYDHDEDSHKYGTPCRVCQAEELRP